MATETPDTMIDGQTDQVAQAAPEGAEQPIGTVETLSGTVTVIHSDGSRGELETGSPVFQGDTIETGPEGAIGVVLADETTFSMAESGSIVLDEMVYDPVTQEGSLSMSIVEGVFTFVSGQVAKTDPDAMTLDTPVATIGIRGTQLGVDLSGDDMTVVLMEEADGFVGEVVVTNEAGVQILNTAFQSTSVASATSAPTESFTMDKSQMLNTFGGTLNNLPKTGNANTYGTDEKSVEELVEEALTEEALTEEELAEEELSEEELSEEELAEEDLEEELSAEELAELETEAGEEELEEELAEEELDEELVEEELDEELAEEELDEELAEEELDEELAEELSEFETAAIIELATTSSGRRLEILMTVSYGQVRFPEAGQMIANFYLGGCRHEPDIALQAAAA